VGGDSSSGSGGGGGSARLVADTRADYWRLYADSPEQPEVLAGRASWDHSSGLRLGERARLALGPRSAAELTLALDATRDRSYYQQFRTRAAQPFTGRLTPGRETGRYVIGDYLAQVRLDGDPRQLYGRLEWDGTGAAFGFDRRLRAGAELRREWNAGPGYQFDVATPPQSTFNGVNGYDRPRRFDLLPPVPSSGWYADLRLTRALPYGMALDLQPGLRADVLHRGRWWLSKPRDAVLQPRLNAQLSPRPWLRLRGAAGRTAKQPTRTHL
jgi:hypothetical protein